MSPDSPAVDHLCRALAHPYRRRTLDALVASDAALTLRDVTNVIVDDGSAEGLADAPARKVTRVYLSLVHVHVPLLADANMLEYDPDRAVIEPGDLEGVRPVLSAIDDRTTEELAG